MPEEIHVGDFVRAYDFPNNKSCYAIGEVMEILRAGAKPNPKHDPEFQLSCDSYKIRVCEIVWENRVMNNMQKPEFIYAPLNGIPTSLGRTCTGVVRL